MTSVLDGPVITADMARELALAQRVCIRPLLRRVHDRASETEDVVALPCGSTREAVCPPCAHKARLLRMQQCTEGWHRTDEPEHRPARPVDEPGRRGGPARRRRRPAGPVDPPPAGRPRPAAGAAGRPHRRPGVRHPRRTGVPTEHVPHADDALLRSRHHGSGTPADPAHYDYRRQALDALHFARLVDRFWQNLRRAAGYKVQYFGAVEPQRRLVPHLHAALRGAIPRTTIRQVVAATYLQLWWPSFDRPVYVHRQPVWDGQGYVDADTGEVLPTWDQALDQLAADPDARSRRT